MSKVLSREDFFKASEVKFKRELVEVPELGGSVYVGELDGKQIRIFNERVKELKEEGKSQIDFTTSLELMALLLSMSVCDENGALLFSEEDVKAIAQTSIGALMNLSARAMTLSGLSSAAIEEVTSRLKKTTSESSTES